MFYFISLGNTFYHLNFPKNLKVCSESQSQVIALSDNLKTIAWKKRTMQKVVTDKKELKQTQTPSTSKIFVIFCFVCLKKCKTRVC